MPAHPALTRVSTMLCAKGGPIWPALGAAIMLVATHFPIPPAHAEEWYPKQCLVDSNCAEVDNTTYAPQAVSDEDILTVTTRHGTALVPTDLLRRESMDGNMHACMRANQEGMQLICLFVPPSLKGGLGQGNGPV